MTTNPTTTAPLSTSAFAATVREVVFIDSRVQDATLLLKGVPPGAEVVYLDPNADGLQQMAAALGERGDAAGIHILAHGSAGQLWLGTTFLDAGTLADHSAALAAVGRGLSAGGDLLVYACDLAANDEGAQFVATLAALTGADVAASSNRTGAGGDWALEVQTGAIESAGLLSMHATALAPWAFDYPWALQTLTVTNGNDSGAGSLRSALALAQAGDTITFSQGITVSLFSQLTIGQSITLDGDVNNDGVADVTLDAQYNSRVLEVTGGTVLLDGLAITRGLVSGAGAGQGDAAHQAPGWDALGAGLSVRGGTVTILHSSFTDNMAAAGGGYGSGGSGGGGGGGFNGKGGARGGNSPSSTGASGGNGLGGNGGSDYSPWYPNSYGEGGSHEGGQGGYWEYAGGMGGTAGTLGTRSIGGGGGGAETFVYVSASGGNAAGALFIARGATVYLATTTLSNNLGAGGGGSASSSDGGNGGDGVGGILNRGTLQYDSASVSFASNHGGGGDGGDGDRHVGSNGYGDNNGDENLLNRGGTISPFTPSAPPVLLQLDGDTPGYTQGAIPALLDVGGNATVTDSDSSDFAGGNVTVRITSGAVPAEDLLAVRNQGNSAGQIGVSGSSITYGGTTIGTWAGGSGADALVVTLNASATAQAVQALVRNLTYDNSNSSNMAAGSRTVQVNVSDGDGGTSVPSTVTVALTAVNAAPTLVTSAGAVTFTEGNNVLSIPVVIDSGLTLADADSPTLASATVAITGNFQRGKDSLALFSNSATMGDIDSSYDASTGVLTLSSAGAPATAAQYQAALRSVTYTNSSDLPVEGVRTIGFSANDGSLSSAVASKSVTVIPVNDAPVNHLPAAQTVAQGSALAFSSANGNAITVTDADPGSLNFLVELTAVKGTIRLTSTSGLTQVGGNGANSGFINLKGTINAINAALDSLVFTPTAGFYGTASLTIKVDDPGGPLDIGGPTYDQDTLAITVTLPAAQVTSVQSSVANGTYKVGDTVTIAVTFDQVVTLNTAGGTPTLLLETGSTDRSAQYLSGSGGNTLLFIHTIQAGDSSADLDYASSAALALNGATLRNASGVDSKLTLPTPGSAQSLAGQSALLIDGVLPIATITVADTALTLGETTQVTITFSEAVTGFDNADLTVANGSLSAVASSDGGTTWTATFTPDANVADTTNTIALNNTGITDLAGNAGAGTTQSNNYTINTVVPVNAAPTFAPAAPGTGKVVTDIGSGTNDEGSSVTVQGDGKIVVAGYSGNGSSRDFAVVRYNTNGTLDTSFGTGGKLVTDIGSRTNDFGYSVTVWADKILVAGESNGDFAVVRYNANGTLDTSFGTGGKLVTDIGSGSFDRGYSVIMQGDKIVVAGYSDSGGSDNFAVVRYNTNGTLDNSFGTGGKLVPAIGSGTNDVGQNVTVQADGKIVVAGYSGNGSSANFAVVRYDANGSLDAGFGTGGKLATDIGNATEDQGNSVIMQGDKIVVAGFSTSGGSNNFAVVRYDTNGTLDTGFGTDGKLVTDIGSGTNDFGNSVTVQDDKIVVAGYSDSGGSNNFAVVRYNTNGTLDTTFDTDGKLVTDIGSSTNDVGRSVTVQADGKIVVAGTSDNNFAVVRYNTDGSLDTSFGVGPAVNTLGGAVAYTENAIAIALDASVAVFDADLAALNAGLGNYSGASVTLARSGASSAQDVFSALGNLAFTGTDAVLSGTTVGTVVNSAGVLTITFNANATQARVNETLSSIGYANTSDAPPASVQINWSFNDGNTGAQGSGAALTGLGSTTVNITPVNDAPTVANAVPDQSATQGTAFSLALAGNTFADADGDALTYTAQLTGGGALPGWLGFNATTGTFSGTPANSDVGTLSIDVAANDSNGGTVVDTFNIVVANTNDAPTFAPSAPGTGKLVTDIGSGTSNEGASVTVQADGKIVVAGASNSGGSRDFAVVRYNTDGTLDTGFGTDGKLVTDIGSSTGDEGRSVTVQTDGKIVVAGTSGSGGSSNFAVVRYNANGSLDAGFGTDGKLVTAIGSGTNDVVTIQGPTGHTASSRSSAGLARQDLLGHQ